MKSRIATATLVAGLVGFTTGCVVHEHHYHDRPVARVQEVYVSEPPPAPVRETVTITPGPSYVWVGGAWAWHGRWTWEQGHWAQPPHRGAVWVPHHYAMAQGRHVWVPGYWR